jgi:hypothetical protein
MFPKSKPYRSEAYKTFVRSLPCVICGSLPCDPHHIESMGMGIKCNDTRTISLCRRHHSEIHAIGKKSFCEQYRIDLWRQAFIAMELFMFDEDHHE